MADEGHGRYGVSVGSVLALIPYVRVTDGAAVMPPNHPYGSGTMTDRAITQGEVKGFIEDISTRVYGHAAAGDRFGEGHWITAYLKQAGADAVRNGAAAYTIGAVSPEGSTGNVGAGYESVLWQRFLEALKEIDETIDRAKDDPGPVVPGAAGPSAISTRPARFRDGQRF